MEEMDISGIASASAQNVKHSQILPLTHSQVDSESTEHHAQSKILPEPVEVCAQNTAEVPHTSEIPKRELHVREEVDRVVFFFLVAEKCHF